MVATKCYARKDLTSEQASACQEYTFKDDFKLNLIKRYSQDMLSKHIAQLENCYDGEAFNELPNNAAKDRQFLHCMRNWRSNLFNTVLPDLEERAKKLL